MHKLEITGYKTVHFASCIDEMNSHEFEYMMYLLVEQQMGRIDIDDFRRLLTIKLLDIRKTSKYYNLPEHKRELIHDNINQIVKTIDSFYEHVEQEGKLVKRLDLSWIKQMLPKINGLYGPHDALTNCTFYEHKEAFSRYTHYLDSNDENSLDEMIAILYRPRPFAYQLRRFLSGYQVPERQPFTNQTNSRKLERRVRKVKHWPAHIKTAITIWYSNCLGYLRTGTPTIDGNEIDLSILFKKNTEENQGPAGIGLMSIIFSLAETQVFGDMDKTGNTNLYDVLARLYQLQLDYNAMKSKTNKNTD